MEGINFDLAMFLDEGDLNYEEKSFVPGLAFANDEDLWINSGVLFHEYAFGVTADFYENSDT